MKTPDITNKNLEERRPKWLELKVIIIFTVLTSLILSLSQVLNDQIINSDGILYVQLATLIQANEWHEASKLYNWLFYPYLIATTANITSFSLEVSAHLLNATFTSITCCIFILIVKEFSSNSNRMLLLAAIIILAFPSINEYRQMIIRDHGYWAFYMVSSYFFIKSFRHQRCQDFILLIIFCALSSLFRIEGVVLLFILPFIIFIRTYTSKERNKNSTRAIYVTACIFSACILLFSVNEYGKLKQVQIIAFSLLPSNSAQGVAAITHTKHFLNSLAPAGNYSEGYAPMVLSLTFLLILVTEIVSSIGIFYALLITSGIFKIPNNYRINFTEEWWFLIAINISILSAFLLKEFFLAGRYPLALSLTAITLIPPLANNLFFNHRSQNKNLRIVVLVIFSLITIDSLISFGAKKDYLKEAGAWVISSKEGEEYSLFTNSPIIKHYSGQMKKSHRQKFDFDTTVNKLNSINLNEFDLFAIKVSRKNKSGEEILTSLLGSKPITTFENKRGDKALIYIR